MNSFAAMEKASCKLPPNTNVSASNEHLGLDLKSKGNENEDGGCSRPSSRANASSQLDRKRKTQSPAAVLPQCRKSEDPTVSMKPLSLTPKTVLSLAQRRFTAEFATPECFGVVAFESPISQIKAKCGSSGDILESCLDNSSGIVVAVRVRPFTSRELDEADVHCVVSMEGNETMVTVGKGEVYRFMYDYSFWSFDPNSANYANQVQVYEALAKPLLGKVFEGYNTCLFAYGQTGSGKSYSVMGRGTDVGVIPRFCEDLFKRIDEADDSIKLNVELSFFEIYNEKIHDLLSSSATKDKSNKKICLKVREHPVLGPYVEGLSSYVVKSFEDVSTWITIGNRRRATAATGVNDNSSRSHSVFALLLTQTRTDDIEGESLEHNVTSRINLVDLAGSERQSQAKTSGERLREGASINRSLMTLGKVISNLSENSLQTNKRKRLYIPYRESVLTWLLKESLGGNSKTAMLATISPSSSQMEETLSSLRYAKQARYIINMARINEDANAKLIRDLRTEIEKLKCQTGLINDDGFKTSLDEVRRLREQLLKKETEMAELTRSWQERLLQSEQRKIEEAELLEKSAMALKVDYKLPNLVNLNEDPQLSEVLVYVLREGKTRVGRARDGCQHDIMLSGPLIEDDHCLFENHGSLVSVEPLAKAVTFANGVAITGKNVLRHGDRIVFGGNHYFRFNNPLELSKVLPQGAPSSGFGGLPQSSCHLKDFEFAREELITKQNLRLEAELEQVRIRHEEEVKRLEQQTTRVQLTMEEQLAETKENARTVIEQYEDRIAELNRLVGELRQEKLESVQSRLEAKDTIRMLEAVKEDLKNRLSMRNMGLQLEESKEEVPLCDSESLLIERLKELVDREKQSLAKTEQRRNAVRSTDNPLRLLLMLQEANRISDFLKRDARFMQEVKYDECKDQILIKVLQTRLNVSTFWTLEKFEQKLLEMKELYQNPDCGDADGVFFDPSDSWESESCIAASSCLLETLKKGLQRQSSIGLRAPDPDVSTGSLDLSLSSVEDYPVSVNGHSIGNSCSSLSVQCFMENCQQNLKASVDWFRSASKETLADKYLWSCNSILKSVTHLTNSFPVHPDFLQTSSNHVICLRLTSAFDSMSKLASVWLSSLNNIESDAVTELCNNVTITVTSVGMQIQLFLQGLTNQVSALVNEASSVVVNLVYRLCQLCGQLSLATQMPIMSLVDRNDDAYLFKLSLKVKVHFVNGCGEVVDRVLCAAIEKLEDHEIEMINLTDEYRPKSSICKDVDSLLGQMVVAVSSVTVLLRKLQTVQIELDTTMLGEEIKAETEMPYDNHYYFGYRHCVQVISNIDGIVGGVSGMIAALRRLLAGKDNETNAKEISLISELISIASSAITAPSTDINVLSALFFTDLCQHASILSDSQVDLLELAAEEVKGATKKIHDLSNKMLSNERLS